MKIYKCLAFGSTRKFSTWRTKKIKKYISRFIQIYKLSTYLNSSTGGHLHTGVIYIPVLRNTQIPSIWIHYFLKMKLKRRMNEPMNKVSMSNGEFKTGNRASCLVSSSYINYIYFCFHSTVSSCLFFLYQLHIFLFSFYCLVLSLLLTSITYISVLILLSRLVLSFLFHVTYGFSPYIFEGIVPLL